VEVSVVHRRETLRAEQFLQQSLTNNNIPILWNSTVKEILGDKFVTGVILANAVDKTEKTMKIDGVFVAIGYTPNNDLARKLGVESDEEGYIKVDPGHRTNIKGIYAAGDITGGLKQIVTAVSQGAVAATSIFEDVSKPYWKKKDG